MPHTEVEHLLSVVVACWNAAGTLAEQLAALERQDDDGPWELIVVDNGSTDASERIARGFADRLPLQVVSATDGRGPGYARNAGVERARGAVVAFCDADDVVADDWLRRMRAALARHDFVAGRFRGDLLNAPWALSARPLDQQSGLQLESWISPLPHAGAGNLGVRRSVFRAVGGFDPEALHLEDADLCWRIQRDGTPLVWAPEVVVQVRLRASLRTVFGQAFAYGRGSRWLLRRHGGGGDAPLAAAATPLAPDAPSTAPPTAAEGGSTTAPLPVRPGARGTVGRLLWSVGWRVGFRWPVPRGRSSRVSVPAGGGR